VIPATEALDLLRAGNLRFARGNPHVDFRFDQQRLADLAPDQEPFAVVLGCSDSRVAPEVIFDQSLGDLFVVRVAGAIASEPQVGSIELAAEQLGSRLVVVLGHTSCGAVQAAVAALRAPDPDISHNLASIIGRIIPSIEILLAENDGLDDESLVRLAVRANVRAAVDHLRHGSAAIARLIANDGLQVVGAEYCLQTGHVEFFGGDHLILD